jgi:hypothetical protein
MGAADSASIAGPFEDQRYRVRGGGFDVNIDCTLDDGAVISSTDPFQAGRPGLRTNGATARYHSFTVYGLGGEWEP